MKKTYKLYSVRLISGVMLYDYISTTFAMNIIEAEYLFGNDMKIGCEYQITVQG